jgi:hypothetical protein
MGAHSAMPGYPAAMSTLAQPMLPPGRWHAAKVTAGVLCFVAVVLVVASSFLPLYSGELGFGGQSVELTITPWHADFDPDSAASDSSGDVPKVGYPMVFAAVILACAAAACWYAATPTARPIAGRAAGVTTAIGGAFLIGTVWTTALLVSNSVDYVILLGTLNEGLETDATYLVGYWLLLTASVLAFTAAILSLVPARQPSWQQPLMPGYPYAPTPSYGMALPMEALPRPATPPAGQVNPLTGHPTHIDPRTGQPAPFPSSAPLPPAQGPAPGYPLAQGPAGPAGSLPFHQGPVGPVDPVTGQPLGQGSLAAAPFAQSAAVDPVTGQPVSHAPLAGAPDAVDPLTGLPFVPGAVPATGPVSPPAGLPAPAATDTPGAPPTAPVAEPAPIVVPDAPSLPETPPGPAIPPDEDPLAEPPTT